MPLVRFATNLSRRELPEHLGPKTADFLAKMLSKDGAAFKWFVDYNQSMGRVSEPEQLKLLNMLLIILGNNSGEWKSSIFVPANFVGGSEVQIRGGVQENDAEVVCLPPGN